jgi:hypothetical protein
MTDPQSFNRYAYVQNDPVNFVDPSGLMTNADCTGEFNATGQCSITGGGARPIDDPGTYLFVLGSRFGGYTGGTGGGPGIGNPGDSPPEPATPAPEPAGTGLPDCVKNYLAKFFDRSMLDAITLGMGIPFYVPIDARAFTMNDHIYYKEGQYDAADGIQVGEIILMGHETAHVRQYRQNGRLRQKVKYLANSAKMGAIGTTLGGSWLGEFLSYFGNKFEKEASIMEQKIRDDLARNGNPCP